MDKNRATPMMPHTKRYRLIFSIWGHDLSDSVTDYETLEEVQEETRLLKDFYKDTPKPRKSKQTKTWDYSDGSSFWGYVVLDYIEEKVLEIYKDGIRVYNKKVTTDIYHIQKPRVTWLPKILGKSDRLMIMDTFFRDPSEIPENYRWDGKEEYEGWLRYRWGDGSNAIKPRISKKILGGNSKAEAREEDPNAIYDEITEKELMQRKLDRW